MFQSWKRSTKKKACVPPPATFPPGTTRIATAAVLGPARQSIAHRAGDVSNLLLVGHTAPALFLVQLPKDTGNDVTLRLVGSDAELFKRGSTRR